MHTEKQGWRRSETVTEEIIDITVSWVKSSQDCYKNEGVMGQDH